MSRIRSNNISQKLSSEQLSTTNDSKNNNSASLLNIRAFKFPGCWTDDERMDALLAPFRLRAVNPVHFDNKMKFWQDLIAAYCIHKNEAHFSKREMQLIFTRGERLPRCLDLVIADMLNNKKIRRSIEYVYDPLNTWTGWAINSFVKKPFAWSIYKLKVGIGLTDGDEENANCEYVHLDVIKQFCVELEQNVMPNYSGRLMHYDAFKRAAAESLKLSDNCLQMCLYTLFCQDKIGLQYKAETKSQQIHLIKIPSKANDSLNITDSDLAIHNLEMMQNDLLSQLEELAEEIKLNEHKVRINLQDKKRQLAKTYLRKKRLLEKNHENRSVALHNIETLLNNVYEAQSNGEILDAYKIGSKALQNVLNESGLKYDNVDEIISEVKESLDNHKEVQDTIANANLTEYDNDELEDELREMMGEVTPNRNATVKPTLPAATSTTTAKATTPTPKSGVGLSTNNVSKIKIFNNGGITATSTPDANITKPTLKITDEDLLLMLADLDDVEDASIHGGSKHEQSNSLLS